MQHWNHSPHQFQQSHHLRFEALENVVALILYSFFALFNCLVQVFIDHCFIPSVNSWENLRIQNTSNLVTTFISVLVLAN